MNEELRMKLIDLAACYYANWRYEDMMQNYEAGNEYYLKYKGAEEMAALMGIKEREIQDYAIRKWAKELQEAYDEQISW